MNDFMANGGFLSPTVTKWIGRNRHAHRAQFKIAEDVNKLGHELVSDAARKMGATSKGAQERLVFAALLRGLGIFQAVIILAERGMVIEMSVLTRTLLELEFKAAVATKSEVDAEQILLNDRFERKAYLESILLVPASIPPSDRNKIDKELTWLKTFLQGKTRKLHKYQALAAQAGQSELYNVFYRYYSGAIHSSPTNLKQHARVSADKKGITFKMGPSFNEVPFFLVNAMFIQIEFLKQVYPFFRIDYGVRLTAYEAVLKTARPRGTPTW